MTLKKGVKAVKRNIVRKRIRPTARALRTDTGKDSTRGLSAVVTAGGRGKFNIPAIDSWTQLMNSTIEGVQREFYKIMEACIEELLKTSSVPDLSICFEPGNEVVVSDATTGSGYRVKLEFDDELYQAKWVATPEYVREEK